MGGVTLTEVQDVLSRDKTLSTDMRWTTKQGKMQFQWYQCKVILGYSDEVSLAENLYVLCQWQRRVRSIPERWTFGLMFNDMRVYAIDVKPDSLHTNSRAGKGRPFYRQMVPGIHEHTWSSEGYGYAEPIELPLDEPDVIWQMFLKRAGIGRGDFFHPDNNQPELDL